jgi:hypothetical protein
LPLQGLQQGCWQMLLPHLLLLLRLLLQPRLARQQHQLP